MRKTRRLLPFLLALASVFVFLHFQVSARADYSPRKLKIAGLGFIDHSLLPIVVGDLKGFYRAEGILIELVNVDVGVAHAALKARDIDVHTFPSPGFGAIERGEAVKMIFVINRGVTASLVARPGINSFLDLRGKTVAVNKLGFFPHRLLEHVFYRPGLLDQASVNFVGVGSSRERLAGLVTGSVDASFLYPPLDSIAMRMPYGFKTILDAGSFPSLAGDGVFVRGEDFLADPDKYGRFIRATRKSIEWMRDSRNRQEVIEISVKAMSLEKAVASLASPQSPASSLAREIAEEVYAVGLRTWNSIGCASPDEIDLTLSFTLGRRTQDLSKFSDFSLNSC